MTIKFKIINESNMGYKEIKIPQINVNDEKVTLENLSFENLSFINKGDIIFSISTAKSVEDFVSESSGYIVYLFEEGDEIKIGETAVLLFKNKEEAKQKFIEFQNLKSKKEITIKASKKAIKYADNINFDLAKIKKTGIIKVKDIEEYINNNLK